MIHSFPMSTRMTVRNKPLFNGMVCFRRILRRKISVTPALLSSTFVDFLEDQRCVAIMEGQPWTTVPPRPPSMSKNMTSTSWRKSKEHTATTFNPFVNHAKDAMSNPFVHPNVEEEIFHLSTEKNYFLRLNGHTTTASGGAGIGLILEDPVKNQTVWSARLYVAGDRTPIEAEYSAVILGMDYVCNILKVRRLTILSSNEIIVNQIQGIFATSKSSLEILLQALEPIRRRLLHFAVEQVSPTENSKAIAQAVKALATRKSLNIQDEQWKVERRDPIQKLHRNPLKMGRWRKADDPAQSTTIDPSRLYRLQFDGGAAKGHVGAGMVLYDDNGTEIWCGWHFHPEAVTNNVAEYMGLICGLRCASSLGVSKLLVEGDSLLVVQQMTGNYQTRERDISMFREEAHGLIQCFSHFQIRYIPRAENKRADWLANHAMDLQESDGFVRINNGTSRGGCE